MPKATFFRLADERRERVVRESIAEFSERTYAEASLSEIARRSEIPKGSFYWYRDYIAKQRLRAAGTEEAA